MISMMEKLLAWEVGKLNLLTLTAHGTLALASFGLDPVGNAVLKSQSQRLRSWHKVGLAG